MSRLNRRAMLAGAALAVPTAAIAAAPIGTDAELLSLGAQLDSVIVEWRAQRASDEIHREAVNAAVEQATGIFSDEAPDFSDESPAALRYRQIEGRIWKKMAREEDTDEKNPWNDIHGRMFPLASTDGITEWRGAGRPAVAE
jgi:hypothetical protein